jgi:hypothetical protein
MAKQTAWKNARYEADDEEFEVAVLYNISDIKFGPEVSVEGVKRQSLRAVVVAAPVFAAYGLDCWITSWVRPDDDDSLHKYGMAVDLDTSLKTASLKLLLAIEAEIQRLLGENYFVTYHKSHFHIEYDPGNQGIAPYLEA